MDKYRLGTNENRAFLKEIRDDLVRFGKAFASESGSSYYLDSDGKPMPEKDRETWITARMAHVYSMAAMMGYEGADGLAQMAINGLLGELSDKKDGGWYSAVDKDGNPRDEKQCYAHSFVILAATSAMLAGVEGSDELLRQALEINDRYFWEEENGLVSDTWSTDFTENYPYRGINANMHTVEAYLAVADVIMFEDYRKRASRIIEHVIGWARDNDWRIPEHFDENWNPLLDYNRDCPAHPFKPYGTTPGHGIEWSRLIAQWAVGTYGLDEKAEPYIEIAEKLYDRAFSDAWCADGKPGIVYTVGWDGKPVVHDRNHWTLAEAINTSSMLYNLTSKQRYADDYETLMRYLDETVLDHEKGSWLHQLDQDNHVIGTVWPGKPDLYHAYQATLIPYAPAKLSIALAVADEKVDI